jgi:hypothetical protein
MGSIDVQAVLFGMIVLQKVLLMYNVRRRVYVGA